jgi:hypothetical protein
MENAASQHRFGAEKALFSDSLTIALPDRDGSDRVFSAPG